MIINKHECVPEKRWMAAGKPCFVRSVPDSSTRENRTRETSNRLCGPMCVKIYFESIGNVKDRFMCVWLSINCQTRGPSVSFSYANRFRFVYVLFTNWLLCIVEIFKCRKFAGENKFVWMFYFIFFSQDCFNKSYINLILLWNTCTFYREQWLFSDNLLNKNLNKHHNMQIYRF